MVVLYEHTLSEHDSSVTTVVLTGVAAVLTGAVVLAGVISVLAGTVDEEAVVVVPSAVVSEVSISEDSKEPGELEVVAEVLVDDSAAVSGHQVV